MLRLSVGVVLGWVMEFVGEALSSCPIWVWTGIAVAIALVVVAAVAWWHFVWRGPLKFDAPNYPNDVFVSSLPSVAHRKCGEEKDTNDPRSNATGMIGELLTALIMVNDGWRQLPSQPDDKGIDGIFIREVKNKSEWRVCIAETKASREGSGLQNYEQDRNERGCYALDESEIKRKLCTLRHRELDQNAYPAQEVVEVILDCLKRRSRFLTTQLFVHSFDKTDKLKTEIYLCDRQGSPIRRPKCVGGDKYMNLLVALEIGIARLVRKVSEDNPAKVIIDTKKVAMQDDPSAQRN